MLGKTNITALSERAVVTEIEDFRWVQMQSGVYGNFVRTIYKNGYLAAITADGAVVYTKDGEVWHTSTPEFADCKLNDIEWDGSRFLLAGCYTNENALTRGLVVATEDFATFVKLEVPSDGSTEEYILVFYENGAYIFITTDGHAVFTNLTDKSHTEEMLVRANSTIHISAAKNTKGVLVYTHEHVYDTYQRLVFAHNDSISILKSYNQSSAGRMVTVFECKDTLYVMGLLVETNYGMEKVTAGNEVMTVCTGQNFMFVDGVYFNNCQVFINNHEMLVVKKNESLADKTTDDLVEIAPELTMNCITKAFGQIYIFGNQGVILRSSVETDNGSALLVQTLSAKKALAEAVAYADEKFAAIGGIIRPSVKETAFITNNGDLLVEGVKGIELTDITDVFIKSNTYKEGMIMGVSSNGMGYIIAQNFSIDCSKLTDSEKTLIRSFDAVRFSRANNSADYPVLQPGTANYEVGYSVTGKNGRIRSTTKMQVSSNAGQNYFQYSMPDGFRNDDSSNLLFATAEWCTLTGINVKK